ncbi:hypothetical protein [Patulibacter minatonensis]|uniref:hypothetical protein n=1 Tax=Patulibacter minatonensis TaxID=298163 RepID=UPI0004B033E1|nr:hypothetical protein [Patulibacter minatonensis]
MESSQFSKRGAKARGLDEGSADAPAVDEAHRECWVCRSTGKLISGADGEPHEVVCPWCEGTKLTIPAHDAQLKPSETPREKTPEEVEAAKERAKAMLAKRGAAKKSADAKAAGTKPAAKKRAPAKKAGAKKSTRKPAAKKDVPPANAPIPRPMTRKTVKSDG